MKNRITSLIFTGLVLAGAVTSVDAATIYHGIFNGTVDNLYDNGFAPISDGDSFTLRFEIDTTSSSMLFVGLDIGGVTGTFGNTFASINEYAFEDSFTMISTLDSPVGIFNGFRNRI